MSLERGSSDLLNISGDSSPSIALVRDFIRSQGDRYVHFSAQCLEIQGRVVIQRILVLTDRSLLRIPKTTMDTGIFFDCRLPLDGLTQVIVLEGEDNSPRLELYTSGPKMEGNQLRCTLSFADGSIRKTLLLSLCIVSPQLPILQKRAPISQDRTTPRRGDKSVVRSSLQATDGLASPQPAAPAAFSPSKQQSHVPQPSSPQVPDDMELPPVVFDAKREQLHNLLHSMALDSGPKFYRPSEAAGLRSLVPELRSSPSPPRRSQSASNDLEYNPEVAARRPQEEGKTREAERAAIKAMLDHREKKIIMNIEYKLKHPAKAATRHVPGVEYDKAHEERSILPDDFPDDTLLGPSLFPMWQEWKRTGGLLGHSGTGHAHEWTLYNTQDLIESLKAKESELYGRAGPKSLFRVQRMRDLVTRERHMFLNKLHALEGTMREDSGEQLSPRELSPELHMSPGSATKSQSNSPARYSRAAPFRLSQSPTSLKAQVRSIDRQQLINELRSSFDVHRQSMHALKKDQLERQLSRARETSGDRSM